MQVYNIDFQKLFKLFTIIMLRATTLFSELLKACSAGLTNMHAEFMSFRAVTLNRMQYSSQVCYLRKLLNDKYDSSDRRISVVDGDVRGYLFMYKTTEDKPVMINETTPPEMIYRRDSIFYLGEFLVVVPDELSQLDAKIRASLNEYKLVTKQYQVRYENV